MLQHISNIITVNVLLEKHEAKDANDGDSRTPFLLWQT